MLSFCCLSVYLFLFVVVVFLLLLFLLFILFCFVICFCFVCLFVCLFFVCLFICLFSIGLIVLLPKATDCVFNTSRICHGYTSRTTVMFGTLKDGKLNIKQLFQLQKRLPKWRQRFVKNGLKKTFFFCLFVCLFLFLFCFCFCFVLFCFVFFFVRKLKISCILDHPITLNFH